jgi:hypothetical protein
LLNVRTRGSTFFIWRHEIWVNLVTPGQGLSKICTNAIRSYDGSIHAKAIRFLTSITLYGDLCHEIIASIRPGQYRADPLVIQGSELSSMRWPSVGLIQ